MKSEIINRIVSLRNFMRKHKLSAFIIPSTDPHSGEYIPKHWEARKWISGFTGSAGTVVVTLDKAGLWTDSRYFLQATAQLENTGITLFKERLPETPSIVEWLGDKPDRGRIYICFCKSETEFTPIVLSFPSKERCDRGGSDVENHWSEKQEASSCISERT
jgi:hypothetical protein